MGMPLVSFTILDRGEEEIIGLGCGFTTNGGFSCIFTTHGGFYLNGYLKAHSLHEVAWSINLHDSLSSMSVVVFLVTCR